MLHSTATRNNVTTPAAPNDVASTQSPAPEDTSATASFMRRWLSRRGLATAGIVVLLGAVAIWGHATDWSFSRMAAGGGEANAWCKEHNVPEAQCIECNAKLVPALEDYGWCAEHGISQCPLHHPEIAQVTNVSVTREDFERAARGLALQARPENNSHCKHYQRRIQFASTEAIEKAGIDISVVQRGPVVEAIVANGEVIYDQTRLAHLASRTAGTVASVEKHLGDRVRSGELLALVDSADVGKAKADLLQAISDTRLKRATVERLTPLTSSGAVPGKQIREAEAALSEAQIKQLAAEQALVNLGLPVNVEEFGNSTIEEIAKRIRLLGVTEQGAAPRGYPGAQGADAPAALSSNLLPIRAPLDGIVVQCKVVPGESATAGTTIFSVADLAKMWLILDVRQEDAGQLSLGQQVLFRSTESKDAADAQGVITWISTETDDTTRTLKVRAELPNQGGKLRSNTFGTGRIVLRQEPEAIVIPAEALHTDGDCNIVFVRDKDFFKEGAAKFFHVREVRPGVRQGDMVEVIAGLLPGEVLASKNSMVLEAQLMKSNLGEGCACCAAKK
jgi:membrane fusion protein, heavy metal efflux system